MRKRLQRWTAAVAVLAAGAIFIVSTASSTPASASSSGAGGLGAGAVTNYLKYVEAKKGGAASKSFSPVQVGFVNQQGGPVVIGANATNGAELAVAYANAQLGGIDGHPIKLDTCFIASAEAEGTTCGESSCRSRDFR